MNSFLFWELRRALIGSSRYSPISTNTFSDFLPNLLLNHIFERIIPFFDLQVPIIVFVFKFLPSHQTFCFFILHNIVILIVFATLKNRLFCNFRMNTMECSRLMRFTSVFVALNSDCNMLILPMLNITESVATRTTLLTRKNMGF